MNRLTTYGLVSGRALAYALLIRILSLWDSSLVDAKSRATPEPTHILKNPKGILVNEDTFFCSKRPAAFQIDCFGQNIALPCIAA